MENQHTDKNKLAQEMMSKSRAKSRFRAIVRMVMANVHWLAEDVEQYEGDNVKKMVEKAMRSTGKAKQKNKLLKLNDKALLNKPALNRTEDEKNYIYRIIGGLKCFKRYPIIVKKRLAAVTYFRYYSPGRVIVRQNHEARALYFIMSGEVIVSQLVFDELLQKYNNVDVFQMSVGDMFGEVSLLHNINRTATCTTLGHCEFLILMKEDFKSILQESLQRQWDEVKRAMSAFTYFKDLDEVSRREACIVSKMKSYEANETILGDNVGASNFIYFVLSGNCQMIETLQVLVTSRRGRKHYKLYDPFVAKHESEPDFDEKYFQAYKSTIKDKDYQQNLSNQSKHTSLTEPEEAKNASSNQHGGTKKESVVFSTRSQDIRTSKADALKPSINGVSTNVLMPPTSDSRRSSIRFSLTGAPDQKLQTFFMQVCLFIPGSTFGFGENMRDRRIVAQTQVDCLLIPTVWLLQRNVTNIWTRVHHYLEKKIPTKKELFHELVSQRRWHAFRQGVVDDVVSRTTAVNTTTKHDVPYSIRLEESLDI